MLNNVKYYNTLNKCEVAGIGVLKGVYLLVRCFLKIVETLDNNYAFSIFLCKSLYFYCYYYY